MKELIGICVPTTVVSSATMAEGDSVLYPASVWRPGYVASLLAVAHGIGFVIVMAGGGGGCQGSRETASGAKRETGAGQALVPDENGRIEGSTTGTTGIAGRWFATADTEDCRKRGKHTAAECSLFVIPDPRTPAFRPTGDLGMCTVGIAGKVVLGSDERMDWANISGARIGLTLGDGGPYDAVGHGVTGFAFHIDSEPPPGGRILVELATETARATPPWWGGAVAEVSPVHGGDNQFRWADVGG